MRRISTAGGATRISLKECIQLAVSKPDPALTELVELIKAIQLDLELQRGTAMAAGQRHQQPGRETGLPGGLDLASDQVDRTLAVDRQHIVGKAGKIHGDPPGMDQPGPRIDSLVGLADGGDHHDQQPSVIRGARTSRPE
jgi:hypothetical protein